MNWFEKHVPYAKLVEESFDTLFKTPIVTMFYYLGKDYYSKFSKVVLFTLLVLFPGIVIFCSALFGGLLDWLDPVPEMAPAPVKSPKQLEEQERQRRL
jgi:hypothetical protein